MNCVEAQFGIAVLELRLVVVRIILLVKPKSLDDLVRFWQPQPNTDSNNSPKNVRQKHPNDAHVRYFERKEHAEEEEPEIDVRGEEKDVVEVVLKQQK